ncbi:MAG TPA: DUF951 domain-containing protein [Dehalococcoidia bacterium]|nr:DUF951 domain-containing protein [Dehalococcoidia bacterium]
MVRLRKPHPCGGYDWEVTRLGADIGLRCLQCGRRLLLERSTLERRLKQLVSHGVEHGGHPQTPTEGPARSASDD